MHGKTRFLKKLKQYKKTDSLFLNESFINEETETEFKKFNVNLYNKAGIFICLLIIITNIVSAYFSFISTKIFYIIPVAAFFIFIDIILFILYLKTLYYNKPDERSDSNNSYVYNKSNDVIKYIKFLFNIACFFYCFIFNMLYSSSNKSHSMLQYFYTHLVLLFLTYLFIIRQTSNIFCFIIIFGYFILYIIATITNFNVEIILTRDISTKSNSECSSLVDYHSLFNEKEQLTVSYAKKIICQLYLGNDPLEVYFNSTGDKMIYTKKEIKESDDVDYNYYSNDISDVNADTDSYDLKDFNIDINNFNNDSQEENLCLYDTKNIYDYARYYNFDINNTFLEFVNDDHNNLKDCFNFYNGGYLKYIFALYYSFPLKLKQVNLYDQYIYELIYCLCGILLFFVGNLFNTYRREVFTKIKENEFILNYFEQMISKMHSQVVTFVDNKVLYCNENFILNFPMERINRTYNFNPLNTVNNINNVNINDFKSKLYHSRLPSTYTSEYDRLNKAGDYSSHNINNINTNKTSNCESKKRLYTDKRICNQEFFSDTNKVNIEHHKDKNNNNNNLNYSKCDTKINFINHNQNSISNNDSNKEDSNLDIDIPFTEIENYFKDYLLETPSTLLLRLNEIFDLYYITKAKKRRNSSNIDVNDDSNTENNNNINISNINDPSSINKECLNSIINKISQIDINLLNRLPNTNNNRKSSFTYNFNNTDIPNNQLQNNFEYIGIFSYKSNYFKIYIRKFFFENEKFIIDVMIDDITEIKSAERMNFEAKLKQKLFSKMAHEFKTPLIVIKSLIADLNEPDSLIDKKKISAYIFYLSDYITFLINDIIYYTTSQDIKVAKEEINIREILEFCEGVTESLLAVMPGDKKNVRVISAANYSEIEKYSIKSDNTKLKQVLLNLISNSVKFTKFGEIKLLAVIEENEDMSKSLKIIVTDTGIGIKEEDLNIIKNNIETEKVLSINTEYNYNQMGTGLGLGITFKLLKIMDHSFNMKSVYNEGSEFCIGINDLKLRQISISEEMVAFPHLTKNPSAVRSSFSLNNNINNSSINTKQFSSRAINEIENDCIY